MDRRSPAEQLSALPAVHELAAQLKAPHAVAVQAARRAIAERREAMQAGAPGDGEGLVARARALVAERERVSLVPVINATGVIVHTNLGRAPLAAGAQEAVARVASGYCNLEFDLGRGSRGSRQAHVESLLRELSGAEDALVVNNGAGAVLLAVAALAGRDAGVVVSRGQLVEIGGGFRIPEVIEQSGARLIEVGTTNRTRASDYERALRSREDAAVILRVHPSNFRSMGFVAQVPIEPLCRLGVPVVDDVGSGVLADTPQLPALVEEPSVARSVAAGCALVCCSADKLLGGPQAGLLLGRSDAVAAARLHPLARALRIDKLSLAALAATLVVYRDPERARREVPVLAMLDVSEGVLAERASRIANGVGDGAEVIRAAAKVGGGALPLLELEGPVVALARRGDPLAQAAALRAAETPVVGRIRDGRLLLDPRTVAEDEVPAVIAAAARAVNGRSGGCT